MRYSTVPAIDVEALVAHNRQLLAALPESPRSALTWNPATLSYDVDETALDLFTELFNSFI